jgi:hypothetical protein
MKNIFLLIVLLVNATFYAQNNINITQKRCIPKKGFHLKLQRVLDDSRCPEGVTCIWAGEVSVVVEAYKDKQLIEAKTMTLNAKNSEENAKWFLNYLPNSTKMIKSIDVLPYPKKDKILNSNKYYIRIINFD